MTEAQIEVVICLASKRVVPREPYAPVTHHCILEMPHVIHCCPCGVAWMDDEREHNDDASDL